MILYLFFVAAQLAFEFVHHQVNGGQDIVIPFARDEIVLVFRGDQEFDLSIVFGKIDRHFNRSEPVKKPHQLLRLISYEFLRGLTEMPMPRGNLDLHRIASFFSSGPPGSIRGLPLSDGF